MKWTLYDDFFAPMMAFDLQSMFSGMNITTFALWVTIYVENFSQSPYI